MIDWTKANIKDYEIAQKIVKRALIELLSNNIDAGSLQMDIVATHVSGCKLRLKELLAADNGDFIHDICGIMHHLDRTTGKLQDRFVPRFAL